MNPLKYTFLTLMSLITLAGYSQKGKIRSVEDDYEKFAYIKTSEVLLQVAEEGYKSVELFQKLGNSYYFNNDMENAAKWYGELMAMNESIDAEYFWRYAQALKGVENYAESDKWMEKFNSSRPDDSRGQAFKSKVDYLSDIDEASNTEIELKNLDLNSENSDFGTAQFQDQLVFASTRGKGRIYRWNEQPYLDLYSATKQADGTYSDVTEFNDEINTKYHESSAAYTPDDKYMFFTRNNYHERKYRNDEDGVNRLKLYRARMNEAMTDWDDVEAIHFNSDEYSTAHPTINVQGTKLYFSSDMPGGKGNADLYAVDILEDGKLGEPVNLGPSINTEGSETFPFVNEEGDLYFSTDGYPGLGGLDVYVIRGFEEMMAKSNPNYIVENVGRPFNSSQDDFGYYENLGTKEGFITSNRDGGKGDDDIYSFVVPECTQLVEGIVKDKETREPLPNAVVTLYDETGTKVDETLSDENAQFSFELECEKEYLVRGEKPDYIGDEKRFTTPKKKQKLEIELLLEKDVEEIQPCDDLAKVLDIPIIYFDFDKFNIRYDAEVELQKVLAVLNQYPTMTIDIRSHTDCRGTMQYNETLSENRAESTRQYLIDKGIDAGRLTAKGYGESRLVNDCGCEPTNESSCSEEEHQLNRRSEFIITSIKGQTCDED